MMKLVCDCGCGHAITEYDAGQMPIILQRGGLLMELRIVPGPDGQRPHVRPSCARAAVMQGDIVFPRMRRDDASTHLRIEELHVRSISTRRVGSDEGLDEPLGAIAAPVSGPTANVR